MCKEKKRRKLCINKNCWTSFYSKKNEKKMFSHFYFQNFIYRHHIERDFLLFTSLNPWHVNFYFRNIRSRFWRSQMCSNDTNKIQDVPRRHVNPRILNFPQSSDSQTKYLFSIFMVENFKHSAPTVECTSFARKARSWCVGDELRFLS